MIHRIFLLVGAMMLASHSEIVFHQSNFWQDPGIWFNNAIIEDLLTTAACIMFVWLALRNSKDKRV